MFLFVIIIDNRRMYHSGNLNNFTICLPNNIKVYILVQYNSSIYKRMPYFTFKYYIADIFIVQYMYIVQYV
jgi:hypothetical protein